MVGVGGRSHVKRCHTCRRRKIKCDGVSPACWRCVKQGLTCPGYQKDLEIIFFDQDSKKGKTSQKKSITSRDRTVSGANKTHWELRVPPLPDGVSPHSLAVGQRKIGFITFLRGRYVPDYSMIFREKESATCTTWITTTCGLANTSEQSEMLSDSLLAMSLSLLGLEQEQKDLSNAGLKHYSQALTSLRTGLETGFSLDDSQMDISLVTCLTCGMYEMMANRSAVSLVQHLGGVAAILTTRGVGNLCTAISRRTFYEYRAIYLPIALGMRQSNFLSTREWLNPIWKAEEPHSASHLHRLIDPALLIPILMEKFDLVQQSFVMGSRPHFEALNILIEQALAVQRALDDWESHLRAGMEMANFYIPRLAKSRESLDSLRMVYPISYDFPDWDVASGLVYREMVEIYLNRLLMDMERCARQYQTGLEAVLAQIHTDTLVAESIEAADKICQSIEYFLDDNEKLIGRMVILAPFEAAKTLFKQLKTGGIGSMAEDAALEQKYRFCQVVLRNARNAGLPVGDD